MRQGGGGAVRKGRAQGKDCRGSGSGPGGNHEVSPGAWGETGARHREGRALPAVAPHLAGRLQVGWKISYFELTMG